MSSFASQEEALKHGARIKKLRDAQGGYCAGCGFKLAKRRSVKVAKHCRSNAITFDHVVPRHQGGLRTLCNGLAKHRSCNMRRGSALASGCDLIWQAVVYARLDLQP